MKSLRKGLDSGCASPGYCFDLRVFKQSCSANASFEQNQWTEDLAVSFFFIEQGVYVTNSELRADNGVQVSNRSIYVYKFTFLKTTKAETSFSCHPWEFVFCHSWHSDRSGWQGQGRRTPGVESGEPFRYVH